MEPLALSKPQGRLRKACESCREVKGRCSPSEEEPSKCSSRVTELEQKIEGILTRLSSGGSAAEQPLTPITSVSSNPYTFSGDTIFEVPFKLPSVRLTNVVLDGLQDVISKGYVTFEQAELSLQAFQAQACNFPFVVVDPTIGLDILRRKRPFVLISILTFTASWNTALQKRLETELKESICKKIIMDGERSIDLLQGLLIYLNWYHFYFDPQHNQLYLFMQMATSMALELGLDKPARQELPTSPAAIIFQLRLKSRLVAEEVEGRRALLGCYYLSSAICSAVRKPNNLCYSAYIGGCGELLADIGAAKSDVFLSHFIRLQRLQEEIKQAFQYDDPHKEEPDVMKIVVLRHRFEQELEQSSQLLKAQVGHNAKLVSSSHAIKVYAREIGFHASPPSVFDFATTGPSQPSWYASPARQRSLVECLEATTTYLNHFLSLSSAEVLNFTTPDLLRLLYAVLILGRFSAGLDAPWPDASVFRASAKFGEYLTALVGKFRNTLAEIHNPPDHYLVYLGRMFEDSRRCYSSATAGAITITENLFASKSLKLTEDDPTAECCVDIPDGLDNCPDFDSFFREHLTASDPVDVFIDWGAAIA
ncbi:hypothetical protein H2200_002326 [Cladophialophora chaetospira]|uniref:Transcription factor domain-containing protein n=1 Tax=Cladophialophora chaetospira TaxID=386627 RepID=A0AA38XIP3_9EURO|nr:hypothetical protein H2200_002326 [Cladophialophora chaetospira]